MIALVTDSSTQVPPLLRDRYGITVVPLTIVIDGTAYLEGVDLDTAEFVSRMRSGASVSTAAPSPGQFAQAYGEMAASGAEGIVSVHVGSELSGTLGAARLGAASSPVPVELVDTGTASFAAGCCVWAAAEALRAGAGMATAAALPVEQPSGSATSSLSPRWTRPAGAGDWRPGRRRRAFRSSPWRAQGCRW